MFWILILLKRRFHQFTEKKKQLYSSEIILKIQSIIFKNQEKYIADELGVNMNEITDSQQMIIEREFPMKISIFSPSYEKFKNEIKQDITIKKPSWYDGDGKPNKRNIIKVLVNKKNEIYLQNELFKLEYLTDTIKKMILNIDQNPQFPEKPNRAVISLGNERETDYDQYLKVYNALKKVYTELWEEKSQEKYNMPFKSFSKEKVNNIKREIPFVLSESEPTNYKNDK